MQGVIGPTLGLVGPVSVHCDWVRQKIRSASSTSVWQHVHFSEQIHPLRDASVVLGRKASNQQTNMTCSDSRMNTDVNYVCVSRCSVTRKEGSKGGGGGRREVFCTWSARLVGSTIPDEGDDDGFDMVHVVLERE